MTTEIRGFETQKIDLGSGTTVLSHEVIVVDTGDIRAMTYGSPRKPQWLQVEDKTRRGKNKGTIFKFDLFTKKEKEVFVAKGTEARAEDLGLPSDFGTIRVY